jgi:hypothetical protein
MKFFNSNIKDIVNKEKEEEYEFFVNKINFQQLGFDFVNEFQDQILSEKIKDNIGIFLDHKTSVNFSTITNSNFNKIMLILRAPENKYIKISDSMANYGFIFKIIAPESLRGFKVSLTFFEYDSGNHNKYEYLYIPLDDYPYYDYACHVEHLYKTIPENSIKQIINDFLEAAINLQMLKKEMSKKYFDNKKIGLYMTTPISSRYINGLNFAKNNQENVNDIFIKNEEGLFLQLCIKGYIDEQNYFFVLFNDNFEMKKIYVWDTKTGLRKIIDI